MAYICFSRRTLRGHVSFEALGRRFKDVVVLESGRDLLYRWPCKASYGDRVSTCTVDVGDRRRV